MVIPDTGSRDCKTARLLSVSYIVPANGGTGVAGGEGRGMQPNPHAGLERTPSKFAQFAGIRSCCCTCIKNALEYTVSRRKNSKHLLGSGLPIPLIGLHPF